MKYMGSKSRISKYIVPIIQKYIDENGIKTYIEPFVGGANVIDKIRCDTRIGIDNNEYLIALYKSLQNGWDIRSVDMSKELYQNVKDNKGCYPKQAVAVAGLLATYNAKWFGGYAGTVVTKTGVVRNYYDEAVRNITKQVPLIKNVEFKCDTYSNLNPVNSVVYCDPPYFGTTEYKDKIDHDDYWNWVRKISANNIVLCSEYSAPDDFECVWSMGTTITLNHSDRSNATEKLFIKI
jgi:DNA adenine methylase